MFPLDLQSLPRHSNTPVSPFFTATTVGNLSLKVAYCGVFRPTVNPRRMSAFYRLPSGLWRAQINRNGVRRSRSFDSKGAATAWAGQQEADILAGLRGEVPNLTVRELLTRYKTDVSPTKKGARWEVIRLNGWERDRIASVRLRQLDAPHVADWQQRRLKSVSSASVRRERNLMNNVFEIARKEWKWLAKNPFEGVRRPKDGKARTRLASDSEVATLMEHASPALAKAIEFALETGMRAGEIAGLKDVRGRVAYLHDTKNGESREVPLSQRALDIWAEGMTLSAGSISAMFAKVCKQARIEGLTFHDLRGCAITRLSKKLDALQLAKMIGHKNPKMLMVYYRESAADIAQLL